MSAVSIEVPEEVLATLRRTPDEFAKDMRLAAAIHWYSRGEVSQGRGAEIAGLSRADFLEALRKAEVPACQETIQELTEDVDRDLNARRQRVADHPAGDGGLS